MTIATWKTPLFSKADAQKVADEISALGDEVKPSDIVEMARNPETESHKCFEWDDKKAAENYRLAQARNIVCNLVYTEKPDDREHEPVRLFYKPTGSAGYKQTKLIIQNQSEYERLLADCRRELERMKIKYHTLAEYDWLWELINIGQINNTQ